MAVKFKYPKTPRGIAQAVFRDWCASYGAVVDVEMAAGLVLRIEAAIIADRERQRAELSPPQASA